MSLSSESYLCIILIRLLNAIAGTFGPSYRLNEQMWHMSSFRNWLEVYSSVRIYKKAVGSLYNFLRNRRLETFCLRHQIKFCKLENIMNFGWRSVMKTNISIYCECKFRSKVLRMKKINSQVDNVDLSDIVIAILDVFNHFGRDVLLS